MLRSPHFASPANVHSDMLRTIYFDTDTGDLDKHDITLRVRMHGRDDPILGMKTRRASTDGPFSRSEIEVRSQALQPDLTLFDANTAAGLDNFIGKRSLRAQFETRVRRTTVLLRHGHSQIELACDEGNIVAGSRTAAIAEVELELKTGEESDLCDLAIKLAEEFPLGLEFTSKAQRGFDLIAGKSPPVIKAASLEFDRDATLDDAVTAVISNALEQFVGYWAPSHGPGHRVERSSSGSGQGQPRQDGHWRGGFR